MGKGGVMNEPLEIVVRIVPGQLVSSLILAFLVAWAYDTFVVTAIEEEAQGRRALTAWEVVGGCSIVIAIFAIGINSLALGVVLLLYFIASGIPMIRGSYKRAENATGRRGTK